MAATVELVDWNDIVDQDEREAERMQSDATKDVSVEMTKEKTKNNTITALVSQPQTVFPPAEVLKTQTGFTLPPTGQDGRKTVRTNFATVNVLTGSDGRLCADLLNSNCNPNIVFVNVLLDKPSDCLLVLYLKNCHTSRYYVFDPYDPQRSRQYQRAYGETDQDGEALRNAVSHLYCKRGLQQSCRPHLTPANALAEFVLQNTYSRRELVLVGSDGMFYDPNVVNKLIFHNATQRERTRCCYCLDHAEMVTIRRAHGEQCDDGVRGNGEELYACTNHAGSNTLVNWSCYEPILVDVSVFEHGDEVENGATLRVRNFRYPTFDDTNVIGELIYRFTRGEIRDDKNDAVHVDKLHADVCNQSHSGCNDWIRNVCYPTIKLRHVDVAAKVERLICLLTPRIEINC